MSKDVTLSEAAKLISRSKKPLIICHARPDGDTLGSAFGLAAALSGFVDARVICADAVPKRLAFITGGESDLRSERLKDFSPDMIIALDTAETSLMGKYGSYYGGAVDLKIDHHPGGSKYAENNHIDGTAGATGELVYGLVCELEALGAARLTREASTALYAAVSDDTGGFRYSNVTARTMRIGAALMDAGADTVSVNHRLFECRSLSEMTALRIALDGMNVHRGGTVVSLAVSNAVKQENGLRDDDLGNVVNILREIDGIELAVFIRQLTEDEGKFKVSMRSAESVDASALCAEFGGGGHARAAGATVSADSAEEAEYKVIQKVLSVIGYGAE